MNYLHQAHLPVDLARRHQPARSTCTEVNVGQAPNTFSDSGSAHFQDCERTLYPALLPMTFY